MEQAAPVEVIRVSGGERTVAADHAATEEPLEVRLHDRPFAVIMRTPGADLRARGGIPARGAGHHRSRRLGAIEHCTDARADIPRTSST